MAKTCIVGGGSAGSGEHIVPASLGRFRINNGIYCDRHNNAYGPLPDKLSYQLAFFNAQFGIRNTRTKQIKPVILTDPAPGEQFVFAGGQLEATGPRVLSQNGNATAIAVSDLAELEIFLKEQAAKGINVFRRPRVKRRWPRSLITPSRDTATISFGGISKRRRIFRQMHSRWAIASSSARTPPPGSPMPVSPFSRHSILQRCYATSRLRPSRRRCSTISTPLPLKCRTTWSSITKASRSPPLCDLWRQHQACQMPFTAERLRDAMISSCTGRKSTTVGFTLKISLQGCRPHRAPRTRSAY